MKWNRNYENENFKFKVGILEFCLNLDYGSRNENKKYKK